MKEYIAKEYKYTQSKCKKFPATTYYTVFFITAGKCTCRSREKTYFCATEEIILVNPGTSGVENSAAFSSDFVFCRTAETFV